MLFFQWQKKEATMHFQSLGFRAASPLEFHWWHVRSRTALRNVPELPSLCKDIPGARFVLAVYHLNQLSTKSFALPFHTLNTQSIFCPPENCIRKFRFVYKLITCILLSHFHVLLYGISAAWYLSSCSLFLYGIMGRCLHVFLIFILCLLIAFSVCLSHCCNHDILEMAWKNFTKFDSFTWTYEWYSVGGQRSLWLYNILQNRSLAIFQYHNSGTEM